MESFDSSDIRSRLELVEQRVAALEEIVQRARRASNPASTPAPAPPAQPPRPAEAPRPEPVAARPVWTAADLEALLSGQGLAWVGGLAVLAGAVFFLGLAFARGWIGPAGRVSIGLTAAALMVAIGAWCFGRREALFGHVLASVGLGTASVALFAATRLYGLMPASAALVGIALLAAVTTATALRVGSQALAIYGLVAVLAAPPLFDAPATGFTIAYLGVVLIGVAAVALARSWQWPPGVAFVLSAPQVADWTTDTAPLVPALAAVAAFWSIYAAAASGPALVRGRQLFRSVGLLAVNALFASGVGLAVLDRFDLTERSGALLLVVGMAHLALGAYVLTRRGVRHAYGLAACAIGVAALVCAAAVQWDGPRVTIAWALGAMALAEARRRWSVPYSRAAALGLAALSAARLVLLDVPIDERLQVQLPPAPSPIFWSLAALALAVVAAVLLLLDRMLREGGHSRWLRLAAGFLVVYGASAAMMDFYSGQAAANLEGVRKLAQVSLSILWALTGGAAFVAGVVRWNSVLRWSGLGLFSLAALKVFLYDLASLDATYKVPSLVGLGLLMLLSSYVYQRLRPRSPVQGGA